MLPAWTLQLARGVLALALGLTITLTVGHTAAFGFLTFGVFALASGAVLVVAVVRSAYAGRMRVGFAVLALVSLAAGVVALAAPGEVAVLAILVGVWALATGALEAVSGVLARSISPLARDWLIAGVLTVALGAVALLVPPDFVQEFTGEHGEEGTLTSSIVLIGVVGAWAILVGVLQCISAVTVRSDAVRSAHSEKAKAS